MLSPARVLKISVSMVDHCPPASLCKAGGEPERAPRFEIFLEASKMLSPARVLENFGEYGGPLPPAGLCKAGGETERAPRFGIFSEASKMLSPARVLENATVRSREKIE